MADVYHDRVKEHGTGTTGNFTLTGALSQFASFSRVGNGQTCRYTVLDNDGVQWGTFGGTWSGGVLSRDIVYETSNGLGVDVVFGSGTHIIFLSPDATVFSSAGSGIHGDSYLTEDGGFHYLTEDGSSIYILE